MAANIYDWDVVEANNATADTALTWAEGQAPSTVNNSARVMMRRGKELLIDLGGSLAAGGTANALTLTAQSAFSSLSDGRIVSFKATASNTAAATLNVNAIGAKSIMKQSGSGPRALAGGEIQNTGIYTAQYSTALNGGSGAWLLVNPALTMADIGIANTRNRIVNGAMQISQENVNAAGTTSSYFAADQWSTSFVTSAGTITSQRVQSVTPNGSTDRYRVTITVADASLAAGEFLLVQQAIEGIKVADFRYGSASAKQVILRFGFKGPAGTYSVALRNSALNRSYVALFTITGGQANTDTEQTLIIPGDTTGTWLTGSGVIGTYVAITLAAGSTFQGATGWQAGAFVGTSAVTNGMGTGGSVFELFDVGLYLDKDSFGIAPKWEIPDVSTTLADCIRYWENGNFGWDGYATAGTICSGMVWFKAVKCITPTVSQTNTSVLNFPAGTGQSTVSQSSFKSQRTISSTNAGGFNETWIANARL